MFTLVRSAVMGVCLSAMLAGQAFALQCSRPEMTDAVLLRWTEHVAFVTAGPSRELPDGQTCAFDAKVVTPVKGALIEGQTFTASYNGWDGCNDHSGGKPTIGQYYRDGGGNFEILLCTFSLHHGVVDAYVKQKEALELSAAKNPGDLGKQLALAGFYVGWLDNFRAAPATAALMQIAPTDPRARLLKARSDLLSAGADIRKRQLILEQIEDLQKKLPVAKVLYEGVKRSIARLNMRGPDGKTPENAELPPSTLAGIDLTGQDLTGFGLGGIVLEDLVAPRSDWTASDLSDENLSGADLTDSIFTEALLARTNFKGAKLQGAKFAGAFIEGADFSGAQMQLANLREVRAAGAKFIGTDLRAAVLTDGLWADDFSQTDFSGADLRGADIRKLTRAEITWTGAKYDCQTRFPTGFRPEQHGLVFTDSTICVDGELTGK